MTSGTQKKTGSRSTWRNCPRPDAGRRLRPANAPTVAARIGAHDHITTRSSPSRRVTLLSRASEKFLIGQSRKFLLTAENWKDGTNRDEPGGTRLAGVAEAGAGRCCHAAARRREDRGQRPAGAKIAGAHEDRWRRGCRARTTGPVVEPADRRADAGACRGVAEAAGVARLRTDVRQPAVGEAARHRGQQGDGARMDGGGRAMEGATAQTRREAFLATATERLRRVSAVGHVESRLAGRQRRSGALPGEVDRRCHQPQWGTVRAARRDSGEHGRAVAVRGRQRADGGSVDGQGGDLHGAATGQGKRPAAAGGGPLDAVRPRPERVGNRLDTGVLAASQGEGGAKLRHRPGPAGEAPAPGQGEDPAGCQQVSGSGVLARVERALRTDARRSGGHASSADAADRFGECAEPCRATRSEQRLHVFVRGPEVSDRADGREDRNAGKEPANRTTSERRAQGAVRRSVCGSERVRSEGASGAEAGREAGAQRSQSGRQKRLDGRLLRTPWAGVVASGAHRQREELRARGDSQSGTPGKSGPAGFAFSCPKPPLGSFTKAIGLGSSMPSWRSGNTHGFCVTGEHSPIASEPTPSRRLWAAAPGATPARRIEHTTGGRGGHSKPERSTLLESGTFYFALTPRLDVPVSFCSYV